MKKNKDRHSPVEWDRESERNWETGTMPDHIGPLLRFLDYLAEDIRPLSSLSAHLIKLARQNLIDESLQDDANSTKDQH